jgi:hypothetical protein
MSQYNYSERRIGKDVEGGGQGITSYFSGVNEKHFVRMFDLRTQESKTRRSESDKTDLSIRPLRLVLAFQIPAIHVVRDRVSLNGFSNPSHSTHHTTLRHGGQRVEGSLAHTSAC